MISLFLCVAAPLLLGVLLVRLAWGRRVGAYALLLQGVLGLGLALGMSSCTFFIWLAATSATGLQLPLVESAVFLSAAAICLFLLYRPGTLKGRLRTSPFPQEAGDSGQLPKCLLAGFTVVLLCAVVAFALVAVNRPHGGGDAYAIWNLRARFLFRGHDLWVRGFSRLIDWSHPDYPLLLPSSIARFWTYLGRETTLVPQVISVSFTFGTIALLISSLCVIRSSAQAILAGVFLLGTAYFIRLGGTQYADIPLGFFILATFVLLALNEATDRACRGLVFLAGGTAGFAAWTKNEGMLFVLSVFFARAAVLLMKQGLKVCLKESGHFAAGLLPVLVVVFCFKLSYAPPNDLFGAHDLRPFMERLTDFHRYAMILRAFGYETLSWGNGLTPVFLICFFAFRVKSSETRPATVPAGFTILGLMIVGYSFVYVLTPHDLRWHLDSSLDRLLLQLWPSFLFMFFLIVSPFENLVWRRSARLTQRDKT